MRPTRPDRTRPGPASTKVRTPAAYMFSTCSTNRTGSATWRATRPRTSSADAGYGPAVVFDQTGTVASASAVPTSSRARSVAAPATTSLWNAQATGIGCADRPASRSPATAADTALEVPEITHCRGALWFATTQPARSAISRTASGAAATAAIDPGSAPAAATMASARRALSRSRLSVSHTPAAHRAVSSPYECPATQSGRTPSVPSSRCTAEPASPRAGWATRVSVTAVRCAARACEVKAVGGNIADTTAPGAVSSCSRSAGKAMNNSPHIPGRWLP